MKISIIGITTIALLSAAPIKADVDLAAGAKLPRISSALSEPRAIGLLHQAIDAQGGEAALKAISTIEWTARGYRNMLEQSERPEGPYIPEFRKVSEIHDQLRGRIRSVTDFAIYPEFEGSSGILADSTAAVRVGASGSSPLSIDGLQSARETLALSPERLLLTAISAPDVALQEQVVLQSVPQDVISFTYDGAPVRLYLNVHTHLPTAIDYSGPMARDGYWRLLGDVTMRTYYSYWWIGEGVRLPMQWDVYRNGLHDSSFAIESLSINPAVDGKDMSISPELHAAFDKSAAAPAKLALQAPIAIAPGVTFIPGSWNVLLVRQSDGVVVIEAPISNAYSELVIAEVKRLYPALPIKAVVSTSDSWPHIAGVRAYVGRAIPVYCLDLNRPILARLAAASYASHPDALQRSRKAPHFRTVGGKLSLGTGANRIELYPIAGETSERQMMAYLPGLRLLYGSDPFQATGDGSYRTQQAVSELIQAVDRHGLKPRSFAMMHVAPTSWTELLASVKSAKPTFPIGMAGH